MIITRIAEKDLEQTDPKALSMAKEMLKAIDEFSGAGENTFVDGSVFIRAQDEAGFSLTSKWGYEFEPYFDGVPEKDTDDHAKFNLLDTVGMSQATVDTNSNSRINPAFGKSLSLRYVLNQVGNIHQPMRNIVRYSNQFPNGDNFGKDHKISIGGFKTLFDYFEGAAGQYKELSYPLTDLKTLDSYVDKLIADYPKSEFGSAVTNIEKRTWSQESYDIAVKHAYTLTSNDEEVKDAINRQLVLAGYRLSGNVAYMMSKQKMNKFQELFKS
eukprot:CAMPEP_0197002344 /NCGR_PEP_ID=MMETSP1380-20130617/6853_1 /TAXON_ID=5936 /ORGANISM="Euplotes crassus, Strain CT5" /LENGTH=269 /DNA_ID=CAMNT_0042420423 /DNA_START=74 /DNA_END=883 /DNA_ORIENTATION=-